MASKRWIFAILTGILAIILGNLYALTLPNHIRRMFYRAQMILVFQGGVWFGSFILWSTVKSALQRTRAWLRRLCLILFASFLFVCCTTFIAGFLLVGSTPHWYSLFSAVCFGLFIQLIFAVLALKASFLGLRLLGKLGLIKLKHRISWRIHRRKPSEPENSTADFTPSRIGRISLLIIFFYAAGIGLYGVNEAWKPPELVEVTISLPKFPKSMNGLKVMQLADIHLGPTIGKQDLDSIVERVNQIKPDMIVLVGDLVDSSVENLKEAVQPLSKLSAPKGKFFVTGNHEYYTMDVENWFKQLRFLGFEVLHNSHARITSDTKEDDFFCLIGTDDWDATGRISYGDGHGMDIAKAIQGCDDQHSVVLLAHQPKAAKFALDSEHDIQLVLSGHTHGGQIFPASMIIYMFNPFYAGLYDYNRAQVYVSQGAGNAPNIPVRIGSQVEINLITLKAA